MSSLPREKKATEDLNQYFRSVLQVIRFTCDSQESV